MDWPGPRQEIQDLEHDIHVLRVLIDAALDHGHDRQKTTLIVCADLIRERREAIDTLQRAPEA